MIHDQDPDQPAPDPRKPPKMLQEHRRQSGLDNPLTDVASISVNFHKPVEETFEVVSPAIK